MTSRAQHEQSTNRGSLLVGAGIFLSRIAGLLREMVSGRVLGNSAAADALVTALRIPNLLQNLLGEGVLSASFVPVYSDALEHDDRREASRVAGAVGALLMAVTAVAVLVIVLLARPITRLLAWGLTGDTFDLAVDFTRITAIGVGFMVMSAWCLGILNSHRSFFLPYVAPVVWNLAQIVALVIAWQREWSLADAARGVRSVSPSVRFCNCSSSFQPSCRSAVFALPSTTRIPVSVMSGADSGRCPRPWCRAAQRLPRSVSRLVPCRRGPVGTLQGTDPLHAAGEPLRDEVAAASFPSCPASPTSRSLSPTEPTPPCDGSPSGCWHRRSC